MNFGSALRGAFNGASDVAKHAARSALAGAQPAAAAAAKGLTVIADVAVAGVGELINLGIALDKVAYANAYKLVSTPYRVAEGIFSDSRPAGTSVTQPCPLCDKERVFTAQYRRELIGSEFAGAGNLALREAMNELSIENPKDVKRHLKTIAKIRQRSLNEVTKEYDHYRDLRHSLLQDIENSNGKLEPIGQLNINQSDFMASNWQLRYGKVVGDRLGLDPTFAAMLNPTGGLVGPGNKGWRPDGALMPESVAYHGAYHDAMGHLQTYYGLGPGYNYMESPFGLAKDNPLAGQFTGIAQWYLDLAK